MPLAYKQAVFDVLPHEVVVNFPPDFHGKLPSEMSEWLKDEPCLQGVYCGRRDSISRKFTFRFSDANTALLFKLRFS